MSTKKAGAAAPVADAQDNQPAAPALLLGGLTTQQLDALKAKHGKLQRVRVQVAKDDEAVIYLKEADRNVTALFYSRRSQNKIVEAGEAILDNCFVAGDERFRTDDNVRVAAAMQAINAINFLDATTEEV